MDIVPHHKLFKAILIGLSLVAVSWSKPVSAQSAVRQLDANVYIDVSRLVLPSVVNISIEPKDGSDEEEDEQSPLTAQPGPDFRIDGPFQDSVSGSGVLIRREDNIGYVLTNHHVIQPLNDRTELKLTFHELEEDSTEFSKTTILRGEGLRVIGRDRLSDLAVIEFLMPEDLQVEPVKFADSDKVAIGEFVLALGNPLNFNHTITKGIVSGKSRYLGSNISLERLLQTDAVIQPGNSGGPLVNLDGDIVGINNAIISNTGYWQGMSFAIPSNDAKRISNQLIDLGRVRRGYLGVRMSNLARRPQLMDIYGISIPMGVIIENVEQNSPAEVAGLQQYDLVTEIEGEQISSSDHMLKVITSNAVNSAVEISVIRINEDRQPVEVDVVANLAERPDERILDDMRQERQVGSLQDVEEDPTLEEDKADPYLGLELFEVPPTASINRGLIIMDIPEDSPLEQTALKDGDIIVRVDGALVENHDDFAAALKEVDRTMPFIITVKRDDVEVNIEIEKLQTTNQ